MTELFLAAILSGAALSICFIVFYIVAGILEEWRK
jgi:hypothetical protein